MIHIDLVGLDEAQIYETRHKAFLLTVLFTVLKPSFNRHISILRSDNILDDDDGDLYDNFDDDEAEGSSRRLPVSGLVLR